LNSTTKKVVLGVFLALLVALPFTGGGGPGNTRFTEFEIPIVGFLSANDWLLLLTIAAVYAIGALGLNILTGLAGQVSLGHAFFMGIGAYTAAWLGAAEGPLIGLGLPMWIWLPAAGLMAAAVGVLVAPTAVRVRGLYLAIVTLGLVFIGEYVFRNWRSLTGGSQSGRTFPGLEVRLWKEEEPFLATSTDGTWMTLEGKRFLFILALLVMFVLLAKNIQRTRVGRAFQAIRDRDVAAEVMGVNEFKYKLMAFGISSFFAGASGALFVSLLGRTIPERWNLLLSVQFIAIVLIGGAGTVSGTLMGSAFVILLPRIVQSFTEWLNDAIAEGGIIAAIADPIVSTGTGDFGIINTQPGVAPGLSLLQANQVIYGLLIIAFLIFEPLGLYGIWLRVRNYWKGWPFTY
ncbi:MAG: branched-chain amino acid ABC transporter permease, partial [Acidimicrobiia bacterium]|nr:branched-chain amino acid ABC transporter permease [Acidimicrobiia bacterium]